MDAENLIQPGHLAYLGVTNTLALLRLLSMSGRDQDAEILALRHQVMVLERHCTATGPGSHEPTGPGSRPCCTHCPAALNHLRLLVRPETVLRWHRDLTGKETVGHIGGQHVSPGRSERFGLLTGCYTVFGNAAALSLQRVTVEIHREAHRETKTVN